MKIKLKLKIILYFYIKKFRNDHCIKSITQTVKKITYDAITQQTKHRFLTRSDWWGTEE